MYYFVLILNMSQMEQCSHFLADYCRALITGLLLAAEEESMPVPA